MAILDDFKARFPEIADADADLYIPILEGVYPAYFKGEYTENKEIILNLLAHLLVNEKNSGSSSVKGTSSKSFGNVSVSYSDSLAANSYESWFLSTKYGARYLMLTRSRAGAYFV